MNEFERPDWLQKHLATLPGEIEPGRDLWPGIARRISASAERRWPVAAMAASLFLGVAAGWLVLRTPGTAPDAPAAPIPVATVEVPAPVSGPARLSEPWEPARERFVQEWPAIRGQIGPRTADIIEENLKLIRRANADIALALEREPENPALRRLLQQTLATEIDVYQRAWNISRHVAATGERSLPNMRGNPL